MSETANGMTPQQVATGVEELTWAEEQFDHRGHLAAGSWWCHAHGDRALAHARAVIRRFNVANGGENTDTAGYHETLTVYYLATLADLIDDAIPDEAWFARHIDDASLGRTAPLQYWSEPALMSTEARLDWLDPDLHELPDGIRRHVARLIERESDTMFRDSR